MLQHAQAALLQQLFLGWKKSKERSAHLPRAKLLFRRRRSMLITCFDSEFPSAGGQSHLLLQAWPTGRLVQLQPVYGVLREAVVVSP